MDQQTFDRLTRLFSVSESRRDTLRVVLASLLGSTALGHHADALAFLGRKKRKTRDGDGRKRRRRDDDNDDSNDRQRGSRDDNTRLADEGKVGKRRKGKGKSKGKGKKKGKDKKVECARAGQAPKRGSPCCRGLVRDDAGRCAETPPPPPPPTDSCVGDGCTDPPPTCAETCQGCCQGETCRTDTGGDVCGENGEPCGPCPCTPDCENKICGPDGCEGECGEGCPPHATCSENGDECTCDFVPCESACCADGQRCCNDECVTGVCCEAAHCPTFTCEITECDNNNQCKHTPISDQTDASCDTVCCNGACCPEGVTECAPDGDCGLCQTSANCQRPSDDCKQATCVNNICGIADAPDGTTCPGGVCCGATCQVGDDCCTNDDCDPGSPICNNGRCVQCLTVADCDAPEGGTVTCSSGFCNKFCDNDFHRLCGPNRDVCQECCNDDRQCSSIDDDSTCVSGTCRCPGSLTRCDMECIDTSQEPNHCGDCTTVCASGTCIGGDCKDPDLCGPINCTPQHDPDCDPIVICPGEDQTCSNRQCVCPDGRVDCNGDGVCEACGRCGVESCPDDPGTGNPGFCCPGGFCSCGGSCEPNCETCWVTPTGPRGEPTGFAEQCDPGCVECWGQCCTACINGECASSGPIGGGSIRRR